MNISNNTSSIQAHQTMMNTTANNVANLNTNAFAPSDTRMSSAEGSVVANTREVDSNGSLKSQTDLAKEIPNQIIAQEASSLNVAAIKTQDEMLGSLLDIKA